MIRSLLLSVLMLAGAAFASAPELLIGPASGSVLPCGKNTFIATALDSVDGDLSNLVQWDNGEVGGTATYRFSCGKGPNGLGTHSVTAQVTNSQGETTVSTVVFTVKK